MLCCVVFSPRFGFRSAVDATTVEKFSVLKFLTELALDQIAVSDCIFRGFSCFSAEYVSGEFLLAFGNVYGYRLVVSLLVGVSLICVEVYTTRTRFFHPNKGEIIKSVQLFATHSATTGYSEVYCSRYPVPPGTRDCVLGEGPPG